MKQLLFTFTLLFTVTSFAQVPNYVPTNGLVGWWPFNGNANDESGNGNNGVVNGPVLTTDRFGNLNSAYDFDGVDDYIIIPDSPGFDFGPNDFSVLVWFLPEEVTGSGSSCVPDDNGLIVSMWQTGGSPGANEWLLYSDYPGNNASFVIEENTTSYFVEGQSDFSNSLNMWSQLIGVVESDSMKIYVNGVLEAASFIGNPIVNSTGIDLLLGTINEGLGTPLCNVFSNLQIDDIGIWNRALTQCEISALYNAQTLSNPIVDLGGDTLSVCGTVTVLDATDNAISSYNWSTGESTSSITVNSSGEYTVEVTDTNGCIGYDTTLVSILDPTITASDTVICIGDSVTLSVSNTGSSVSCGTLPNGLEIGLLGYWPFCGNANDESGNGNNGNPLGPVLEEDRYGNTNSSYSFSSGSDLICTSNSFSTPNILTYSVWVNTTNPGQIVGFNNGQCSHGGTWDRVLGILDTANIYFYTYSGSQVFNMASINVMDGDWHHLIVTLGPGGSNIYVDGSLISSNPSQNIGQGNTGYFRFGGLSPNDANNSMIGTYDDIGIWNRVLTPSEIQELYELGNYDITWSTGDTTSSITVQPTQTTTYSVTVSDGISSCTDDVTVTVNDPQVNLGPDQDVCQGDSVLLDAGAGYDYYSWNTGDTTQSIYVSQGGSYDATVGYETPVSNNYSLEFDGNTNYINCGNPVELKIANEITYMAWVKSSQWTNASGIVGRGEGTSGADRAASFLMIMPSPAGQIRWEISDGSQKDNLVSNSNLTLDTWNHIAVSWDGTNSATSMKIYIDGLLDASGGSTISSINQNITANEDDKFKIGLRDVLSSGQLYGFHNGYIEEVSAWNTALSQEQIQQYMNCPPTGNEAGLVGYWNFEEGSGTTATDLTSNGNNGTLVNGPIWSTDVPNQVCVSCTASDTVVVTELLPTSSSIIESNCDSYTAPDGATYTSTGNYIAVIPNAVGCDSTITIDLTITNSNTGSETATECDAYTWNADGQTYTQSGQYTAVLTNAAGCDSTVTLDLTINNADNGINQLDDITLEATASNAQYQWVDCSENYQAISGATDQTFEATVNGDYACIVTENGCSDTTACITISKVGISDLRNDGISVYPNPASSTLTIESQEALNTSYRMIDAQGREVLQGKLTGTSTIIDIENLAQGSYTLLFNQTELKIIKK